MGQDKMRIKSQVSGMEMEYEVEDEDQDQQARNMNSSFISDASFAQTEISFDLFAI